MAKERTLTPEEEAKIPEYANKWRAIALDCQPANRALSEAAIYEICEANGKAKPKHFLWVLSPTELIDSYCIMRAEWERLKRPAITGKVWEDLTATWRTFQQTKEAPREIRPVLERDLQKFVKDAQDAVLFGQHDAHWLAFFDYFRNVLGYTKETESRLGFMEHARHGGWFILCDEVCICAERWMQLALDDRGRLHNDVGPAIEYRDGQKQYYVQGIHLSAEVAEALIIDTKKLTIKMVDAERNAEIKRLMIERFGKDKYVHAKKAKLVDDDPVHGKLWLCNSGRDDAVAYLEVKDSTIYPDGTQRDYFLMVSPRHRDSASARAATFRMSKEEFVLAMET